MKALIDTDLTCQIGKKGATVNVGFESLNCQIGKKRATVNVRFESLNCQISKKRAIVLVVRKMVLEGLSFCQLSLQA